MCNPVVMMKHYKNQNGVDYGRKDLWMKKEYSCSLTVCPLVQGPPRYPTVGINGLLRPAHDDTSLCPKQCLTVEKVDTISIVGSCSSWPTLLLQQLKSCSYLFTKENKGKQWKNKIMDFLNMTYTQ